MKGGFGGGSTSQPSGKRMLWSIEYYAQFFDVDTKQVLDRCWAAVFPKTPFLDVLGGNPDLYGTPTKTHVAYKRSVLDFVDYYNYSLLFLNPGRISCSSSHRYEILL